jgi:hypothetical protein
MNLMGIEWDITWGYTSWLVVWNIFLFSIIYGISSFPLTFKFFRVVETTNQLGGYSYNYFCGMMTTWFLDGTFC